MSILLRPVFRVVSRRFASTVGSNPQGTQDDPSLAANFVPDFSFPQGLQGDPSKDKSNDAICNLWLQKYNHSVDNASVNSFTEDIDFDFNLSPIIDHKCSMTFQSELLAGHSNSLTPNS
ncbi:unnamed protein product [Rotaria magnacalcarata]|uniref:Uncharacterized protein n=1 Tax=Rotaria magnacalcarata TaxID=392030 RepID=A0A815WL40_9BILA|nr:unnamed protein product [Rotaria magnacalcarata]